MNTTRRDDWEDADGIAEGASMARSRGSRRSLLGGATGGFALAASGLFVPSHVKEAEAREGANSGELGGRHGSDRRGRHRRRKHGNKTDNGKGKENAPGGILFRDVALSLVNLRSNDVEIRFWESVYNGKIHWYVVKQDWQRVVARNGSVQYHGKDNSVLAQIRDVGGSTSKYILGQNPPIFLPSVEVGRIPLTWDGKLPRLLDYSADLRVDEVDHGFNTFGFEVRRTPDTSDHIQFQAYVS